MTVTMTMLVVLLLLYFNKWVSALESCTVRPVEVGANATISRIEPQSKVETVRWRFRNAVGRRIDSAMCNVDNSPFITDDYICQVVKHDSKNYNLTLTLFKIRRMTEQSVWYWFGGFDESTKLGECQMLVYEFFSYPRCVDFEERTPQRKWYVTVNCNVSHVFPALKYDLLYREEKGGIYRSVRAVHVSRVHTVTNYLKYGIRTLYNQYTYTARDVSVSDFKNRTNYVFLFTATVIVRGQPVMTRTVGPKLLYPGPSERVYDSDSDSLMEAEQAPSHANGDNPTKFSLSVYTPIVYFLFLFAFKGDNH